MKRLIFILLTCILIPKVFFGQTNIEKVWLTKFKGDSLIQEKYFYRLNTTTNEFNSRILFEPNRDTFETVITYFNRNGEDSIQLWKYPNREDSWTLHWIYNKKNQLIIHYTTFGNKTNNDTIIYEYGKHGQLIKETRLYENYFMSDSSIYNNGKIELKIRKDQNQILNKEEYSYNNNGDLLRVLSVDENGKKGEKISYKYDSKNRLSKFKIVKYKTDFRPKHIEIIKKFKYNNSDKTIEYRKIDNNYHTDLTYKYEYDLSGEKVKTNILDNYNGIKTIYEFERITLHNTQYKKLGGKQ